MKESEQIEVSNEEEKYDFIQDSYGPFAEQRQPMAFNRAKDMDHILQTTGPY